MIRFLTPAVARAVLSATAATLMVAGGAEAQEARVPPVRSVLIYTVSSVLSHDESGAHAQAALVERLGGDPRLASLMIEKPHNRAVAQVVARFVFEDESELRRWVAGDGGRLLAGTLNRADSQYGTRLEVRRFPAGDLLRLTDGLVLAPVRERDLAALSPQVIVGAVAADSLVAGGQDLESVANSLDVQLDEVERALAASDVASTAVALENLMRAMNVVSACPRPLSNFDGTPEGSNLITDLGSFARGLNAMPVRPLRAPSTP